MPNFYVTNPNNPQNLKTQMYSQFQGNVTPIASDANGNIYTKLISGSGDSADLPLTAFYDLRVTNLEPVTGWTFNYNVNADFITSTTTGSGTVTQSNGKAVLQTTAATSSSAKIETKNALRYCPGLGALLRFTAVFTTGVANSTQIIGVGDSTDGFFFGYNGSSFGILRRQNGSENWVAQSSWNVDAFNGTGASGITLDPTKGNVYSINYQWLGFGSICFYIENPTTGEPTLVHRIQYANANTNPSVYNPTFPVMAQVINTTNTTNIILQTPSAMAFVEGNADSNALVTRNAISASKTSVTTQIPIMTIRNKSSFASKTNRVRVKLDFLSVSTEAGSKPVLIKIIKDGTLGGSPSYSNISINTSVIEYDTAATSVSNGTLVLSFNMQKVADKELFLDSLALFLAPNSTYTFTAQSSQNVDVDVAASWEELW